MGYKFKIGDRVIVNTNDDYHGKWIGAKGTIIENDYCPFVKMDVIIDGYDKIYFDQENLDLITSESLSKSEIIEWLTANPKATSKQILEYLNGI